MSEHFELGRYDLTISTLSAGVLTPAVGCAVAAYRKSALVTTPGSTVVAALGGTAVIGVFDSGPIVPGDIVFRDADTANLLTVTARTFGGLTLQNNSALPITITQYQRLVPFTSRPTVFRDERGTTAFGTSAPNTNSSGATACYARERSLDFVLSGGNLAAPILLSDQTAVGGGFVINPLDWRIRFDLTTDDTPRWQELLDYIALQNDVAVEGVIIELPPGGQSRLASKAVINANSITFRGGGRVGFLGDHATDPIFEVATGFYTRFDGIYFTNNAHLAAPCLLLRGGTGTGRGSIVRCSMESGGGGIILQGRDWTIDDLSIYGSSWSNIIKVTRDGALVPPDRTTIKNVHGIHTALPGDMQACFMIEKGAINTRFEDISVSHSNPASSDATVFLQAANGGSAPEGTVIRGGRFSGGYGGGGVAVSAGDILVDAATAFDCSYGYNILGGTIVTLDGCTAIGCRFDSINVAASSAIVRILHPVSSDASQDTDNAADHIYIENGKDDVHILSPIMGNFIRQSTVWARDGVHYETGGSTFSSGSCRGAAGQPSATEKGIRGKLVNAPDSILTSGSFDISHNADQRLQTYPGTKTVDHIGIVGGVRTVTSGINLDLRNVNTIVLNGAGVLAISTVTNGTEGQPVTIYNQSASTATITDSSTVEVGGSPLNLPQNNILQCLFINGKLRSAGPVAAP